MITSREIMEQENKKKDQDKEALLQNEYVGLVQVLNTRQDIEDKIEADFIEIHQQLIKASIDAPLLKSTLRAINELCDDFKKMILSHEVSQFGLMKVKSLK